MNAVYHMVEEMTEANQNNGSHKKSNPNRAKGITGRDYTYSTFLVLA